MGKDKENKAESSDEQKEGKGIAIEKHQEPSANEEAIPEEVKELVRNLPPEDARTIRSFFGMVSQMGMPRNNPLIQKFTPDHIDKFLDGIEKESERDYRSQNTSRIYQLVYVLLAIIVIALGIIYLLPTDKDLLIQLITIIASFSGGYGIGFGHGKSHGDS